MKAERKWNWIKYSVIVGSIIIESPNGVNWYWGNLSIYSLSYLVRFGHADSCVGSPWIISLFCGTWAISLIVLSALAKKVGRLKILVLGMIINELGLLLSYFAINNSLLVLYFSMGVFTGIGTGIMHGCAFQYVVDYAKREAGRLSAAIQTGEALMGMVINHGVTYYINPSNLTPDLTLGNTKCFTQTNLLDRVPQVFLVIAAISLCLHAVGLLLVFSGTREVQSKNIELQVKGTDVIKQRGVHEMDKEIIENVHEDDLHLKERQAILDTPSIVVDDLTPVEMMKCVLFYALWIMTFLQSLSSLILSNYYKSYGQVWITNDYILTDIGTLMALSGALINPLWGMTIDKIGVKKCLIVYSSLMTLVQIWLFFSPMLNKWLYIIICLSMSGLTGSIILIYTATIVKLFGAKHFSNNLGIQMTSFLAINLVAPPMMQAIVSNSGWWPLFATGSVFNATSLIIAVIWLPESTLQKK